MSIIINIDVMLAKRKMSVTQLAGEVGITMANISILKNGKAKAIKLDTLNKICRALDCQPGDLLEYRADGTITENQEMENMSFLLFAAGIVLIIIYILALLVCEKDIE